MAHRALALLVALAGCKGSSTFPARKVGLRITTAEFARKNSHHSTHLDLPFRVSDKGVNGTALVLAYLQRAQEIGALYVSDVTYALQVKYNGVPIECVSKIRVDDPTAPPPPAVEAAPETSDDEPEYETTVKPWRPNTADQWVVDRELKCTKRAQQVVTTEPRYDNRYNAEVKRYIPPGGMPMEPTPHIVHYDECKLEPTKRFVHRYEHFLAAHFAPPDMAEVAKRYAERTLVEEPPLCHEIQVAPGQALRHHISSDVHFDNDYVDVMQENEIIPEKVDAQVGPSGD